MFVGNQLHKQDSPLVHSGLREELNAQRALYIAIKALSRYLCIA